MKKQWREVRYFLFGQHFAEGLRITFAVLLPSVVLSYYNQLETGLALSLGALCISITDAPGPILRRRTGMLYAVLAVFITTFITGFAQLNIYTLGLQVVAGAFLFSMFGVYGVRAAAVGSAALLVLILNMDKPLKPAEVLPNALLVAGGGIWYSCISLLFYALRPYRLPQRLLGDCIREMARFLQIKAQFYTPHFNLDEGYKKMVAQQITVHEKQDATREILFKTRPIVTEATPKGRALVLTFIESVDLFEDITAIYYDYSLLRKRYGHTGQLSEIAVLLHQLADELDEIGFAVQSNTVYKKRSATFFEEQLTILRTGIDAIAVKETTGNTFVLKKIIVNLRRLVKRIGKLRSYALHQNLPDQKETIEHHRFVEHQSFSIRLLTNNLSFESALFRHAVRTAAVCLVGFVLSKTLSYGQHSYWILMTIAFIMKPAYSLTKERNLQRIIGTLGGGLAGVLILLFVHQPAVLFSLLVLFMLGTYSFLRVNYLVMVSCVTPFVLILFHFLGLGYISIVQERIVDTVIGCVIAFAASYLFLPKWEAEQLTGALYSMLRANLAYLQTVAQSLLGYPASTLEYKLARKEVYVHSANLAAALQRMRSEPRRKQKNTKQAHRFVVLNHLLFSNVASVAAAVNGKEAKAYPLPFIQLAKEAGDTLCNTIKTLNEICPDNFAVPQQSTVVEWTADNQLLQEQLHYIKQLTKDIQKATAQLI